MLARKKITRASPGFSITRQYLVLIHQNAVSKRLKFFLVMVRTQEVVME
jgi:hypothetical protein